MLISFSLLESLDYYSKWYKAGVSLWYSRLRIWHCYYGSSGHCCGVGSVPRLGNFTSIPRVQKKKCYKAYHLMKISSPSPTPHSWPPLHLYALLYSKTPWISSRNCCLQIPPSFSLEHFSHSLSNQNCSFQGHHGYFFIFILLLIRVLTNWSFCFP